MDPSTYGQIASTEFTHWWFLGRRAVLKSILETLDLKRGTRILEIGCGTGGNLEMLSCYGNVSAFEMDEGAVAYANNKTSFKYSIRQGSCPHNIPFIEEKFDLICMFDVLEHIELDMETLRVIRSMLNSNGILFITVPAYQWLFGEHDRFFHHKRRYSIGELQKKAQHSEFNVVRMSYFNCLLFPLALVIRMWEKLFPGHRTPGNEIPPRFINATFSALFSFESILLRKIKLPFGVSLFGVFRANS